MTLEEDEKVDELGRAEDIVLGSLGYGEDAKILSFSVDSDSYRGEAQWSDGEKFDFNSPIEEMNELEKWAVKILIDHFSNSF